MWQCSSVQATHQQHHGKLSVISAPLTLSGPDCWRWRTRVWTSKLQQQPPPNQHWVETPAQVLRWPDHIWVCGEQSGGWIQTPSGETCAMVWWEPSPPECNEDEGDGGGFLLSPDVDCRADVEIIQNYRLEWSTSTEAVYKKALSWLYFHKRFRSLSLCKQMLQMFYSCGEPSSTVRSAQPSKWRTLADWINCSGKLGLRLAVRWSPWRRCWGRGELDPINNL